MNNKQIKAKVQDIVDNFELDGSTDYQRMHLAVQESTGMNLDNDSVWALTRKVGKVSRVSFSLDD